MIRRLARSILLFLLLAVALPLIVSACVSYGRGWPKSWRTADWSSSGLLPAAAAVKPATVMILASRTGRWKGIFSEHMSIVLKPENANEWTRYDVVGWGLPVRRDAYVADAYWYGNAPRIAYQLQGDEAARLIPAIEDTIARYPHAARGSYTVWPGPNSNSFVAWVVRNTDGFAAELPAAAIGKDWLGRGIAVSAAPSRTGYSLDAGGLIGGTLALKEGIELHLLGATIGIDPGDLAIKLPGLGSIGLPQGTAAALSWR